DRAAPSTGSSGMSSPEQEPGSSGQPHTPDGAGDAGGGDDVEASAGIEDPGNAQAAGAGGERRRRRRRRRRQGGGAAPGADALAAAGGEAPRDAADQRDRQGAEPRGGEQRGGTARGG